MDVCDFWDRIDSILEGRGEDLHNLADGAGLVYGTVTGWRYKGRYPKVEELVPICNYLGVTMDYLVTGKEAEPFSAEAVSVEYSDRMKLVVRLMEQDPYLLDVICSTVDAVERSKKIG